MTDRGWQASITRWAPHAGACLGVAVGYVIAAQLGFLVATVHPVVGSVWPPAGLALAVALLFGIRLWPGIFAGALAANAMKGLPEVAAIAIASGNTLAAVWAASALRRIEFQVGLPRIRDALGLLGLGALCAPVIAATIGTLSLHLAAGVPADRSAALWYNWWSGDALGVMLVTPLLIAWRHGRVPELTRRGLAEAALLGAGLLTASVLLMRLPHGYEYAVFPLVGWAAIRGGPRGASIATALVATVAIWFTLQGTGAFVDAGGEGLWRLQLFLALLIIGSLLLTAMAQAEAVASQALALDVARRRQSEEELQRTTQTLQTLIDASPLAIMTLDLEGRVRSWNRAAEEVFGWSAAEAVGQTLPFVPPAGMEEFRSSLRRVCSGEAITGLQVERVRRDGRRIDVRICAAPTRDANGVIDGGIALVEDVTERKSLGEQLRQAQKMEAIGQLTGGLAHDFNNLLTIVITNAALLSDDIPPDRADMRAELSELQRAALRGVELVRKLMAFSRRRSVEMQPIDLGEVIEEASKDLGRLLPASVEVGVQVETGAPLTISGDVGGIEQILFNLATNARDAMPDGGTLRIQVYRAWLDEEHRRTRGWGTPGEYVVVAVSDTGCGMSPKVRSRAFEPFFTTKEVGKGTGLGMAMVYGLATQHKGYADLHSEEGLGTTVRLYFPAIAAVVPPSREASEGGLPVGGTERILVVDDEEGIRRSAARVLTRFGYSVAEASDGEGALTAISGAEFPFNLVVSDVVMPRLSGMALYRQLRGHGSGVRVLLMSGHTAEDLDALDEPLSGARFLHKPWTITDLLRRVREVLDERLPAAR